MKLSVTKKIFSASAVLLLISFTMPTYCTTGLQCGSFGSGFIAFFFGVVGVFMGGAYLCWLANPFLVISWFLIKRKPFLAVLTSGIALAIGLLFMTFDQIIVDESGHEDAITGYAIGYWFWLSSMMAVFLGSLWYLTRSKKS